MGGNSDYPKANTDSIVFIINCWFIDSHLFQRKYEYSLSVVITVQNSPESTGVVKCFFSLQNKSTIQSVDVLIHDELIAVYFA